MTRAPTDRSHLSIGEVLSLLQEEFPDITISKIRFLESEGLVCPGRTPSGYRQFSPADVERLRFVLAAQRDHYLPLKVIKEHLDASDAATTGPRGDRQAAPAAPAALPKPPRKFVAVRSGGPSSATDFEPEREIRLTAEELLAEAGIEVNLLGELEQYGLVRPGAAGFYDPDAVRIAQTVKAMTEYGIEPRHLRTFRTSADREVGLLEQVTAPVYRQRDPSAAARGDELVRELAALLVTLHTLLVKTGLRDSAAHS